MNAPGQTSLVEPGRSIGRYVIYDQMAQGGTARVHLARRVGPEKFSRIVVMKGLKPVFGADEELRAMLRDEAWLAARISHPNVVPVIDVEVDGDEFWLALEYVHGETMTGLMRASLGKAVPAPIAGAIFAGVLHGLHAAHELCDEVGKPLGLVHRDVSPQNIIVGVDGVARVLDFGIAKALGRSQATRDGEVKGKVAYMAPEQLYAEPVSRRTDVFATSIVMWEALTGRRLFLGETESETIVRVSNLKIAAPSQHVQLPPALDEVVLKGLERDAAKRYETARDMALAIEQAIEIASPSQVGAWVENLAAETLVKRKMMIARIEREAPQSGEISVKRGVAAVSTQDVEVTPAQPLVHNQGHARSIIFILATALVIVLLAYFRAQRTTTVHTAHPDPLIVRQEAQEPPPPAPEPKPPEAAPVPEEPKVEIVPPVEANKHRTHAANHAATKKADSCDPPYVIDAQGHKQFKRECF